MTTYRIGDVLPSPFRDIENYPFIEANIEAPVPLGMKPITASWAVDKFGGI